MDLERGYLELIFVFDNKVKFTIHHFELCLMYRRSNVVVSFLPICIHKKEPKNLSATDFSDFSLNHPSGTSLLENNKVTDIKKELSLFMMSDN
jgi:hypothetical protein